MKVCKRSKILLIGVVIALATITGISACSQPQTGVTAAASNLTITAKPFDHWHVFANQKVEFKVTDTTSGKGKTGLLVTIQVARAGSSQILDRTVANGEVKDEGNGIYSLEYTTLEFMPHAFSLRFAYEGREFFSQPYVAEITKAGEEDVKAEINNNSYLYQIRYFWKPGDVNASDKDKVTLSFEIMRSTKEGKDINWKEPWSNPVEHVTNATSPEVTVQSKDGFVKDNLSLVYKGKGVYEAQRLFTSVEVGTEKDYYVSFIFTDPYNGAKIDSEPYPLHARAAQ